MRATPGNIPETIMYITGGSRPISRRYEYSGDEDKGTETVTPAFISDAENQKTIETGKIWAKGHCEIYDYTAKKTVRIGEVGTKSVPNKPLKGIRIFTLEIRSEGGRAYKVITPDGYYVDLREDVLLETMLEKGISKGGVLAGEFVFGKVGSQMKLVRVGSELHGRLIESTSRGKLKKVGKNDLVRGGIYETKTGKRSVFIDYVDANKISYEVKSSYESYLSRVADNHETIKAIPLRNHMLWLAIPDYVKEKDIESTFRKMLADGSVYGASVSKTHAMVKEVGMILDITVDDVRRAERVSMKKYEETNDGHGRNYTVNELNHSRRQSLAYHSERCCIAPRGEPIPMDGFMDLWRMGGGK